MTKKKDEQMQGAPLENSPIPKSGISKRLIQLKKRVIVEHDHELVTDRDVEQEAISRDYFQKLIDEDAADGCLPDCQLLDQMILYTQYGYTFDDLQDNFIGRHDNFLFLDELPKHSMRKKGAPTLAERASRRTDYEPDFSDLYVTGEDDIFSVAVYRKAAAALMTIYLCPNQYFTEETYITWKQAAEWAAHNIDIINSFFAGGPPVSIPANDKELEILETAFRRSSARFNRSLMSDFLRVFSLKDFCNFAPYGDSDVFKSLQMLQESIACAYLSFLSDAYKITQSPIYSYSALQVSHKHGVPIPNWALEYFLSCSRHLDALVTKLDDAPSNNDKKSSGNDKRSSNNDKIIDEMAKGFGFKKSDASRKGVIGDERRRRRDSSTLLTLLSLRIHNNFKISLRKLEDNNKIDIVKAIDIIETYSYALKLGYYLPIDTIA